MYAVKELLLMGGGRADFYIIGKDPESTMIFGKGKEDRWRSLYFKGSEAIISQNRRVTVKSVHKGNQICIFGRKRKEFYSNKTPFFSMKYGLHIFSYEMSYFPSEKWRSGVECMGKGGTGTTGRMEKRRKYRKKILARILLGGYDFVRS